MGLIYLIIFLVILWTIMLSNYENKNKPPENYPPEGYTIDRALMMRDLNNGVSKAEIKHRERTGYYWIKCDHNGVITDKKNWGKPKY